MTCFLCYDNILTAVFQNFSTEYKIRLSIENIYYTLAGRRTPHPCPPLCEEARFPLLSVPAKRSQAHGVGNGETRAVFELRHES